MNSSLHLLISRHLLNSSTQAQNVVNIISIPNSLKQFATGKSDGHHDAPNILRPSPLQLTQPVHKVCIPYHMRASKMFPLLYWDLSFELKLKCHKTSVYLHPGENSHTAPIWLFTAGPLRKAGDIVQRWGGDCSG